MSCSCLNWMIPQNNPKQAFRFLVYLDEEKQTTPEFHRQGSNLHGQSQGRWRQKDPKTSPWELAEQSTTREFFSEQSLWTHGTGTDELALWHRPVSKWCALLGVGKKTKKKTYILLSSSSLQSNRLKNASPLWRFCVTWLNMVLTAWEWLLCSRAIEVWPAWMQLLATTQDIAKRQIFKWFMIHVATSWIRRYLFDQAVGPKERERSHLFCWNEVGLYKCLV